MRNEDRDQIRRLRDWEKQGRRRVNLQAKTKHDGGHEYTWFAYLDGEFPNYPGRILGATHEHVDERPRLFDTKGNEPTTVGEDYLRGRDLALHRMLLQLTIGTPQPIYCGGLVITQVRRSDVRREWSGLPSDVAALVESATSDGSELTLVDTSVRREEVIVQAGAYSERRFTMVETDGVKRSVDGGADGSNNANDGEDNSADALRVRLPVGSRMSTHASFDRFVDNPSYDHPWSETEP